MDATYIQKSIEQLKTSIFMHVRHRTLLQYTGNPVLDENQLFYLLLPLFNGENWDDTLTESVITVGIVHASLVEHDKINEVDSTSKSQQLTVLAGDFYSGRYYEILAKSGNITLIRQLSQGIVARCEHQIKVYESVKNSYSGWFESLKIIESELISKFYNVYNFSHYTPIMEKTLLLLRLQKELQNYKEGNRTSLIRKIIEDNEAGKNDELDFEKNIQLEINLLQESLHEYLNSTNLLTDELKLYIEQMAL